MRKKTTKTDSKADQQLLKALNRHPPLKERILAIVHLAAGQEGTPGTADEIETLLLEEVRQLGRETMGEWAQAQAGRVAREVGRKHPQSYRSKKKTLRWWCVFGKIEVEEWIWRTPQVSYLRVLAPRLWKEMRLVAARAQGQITATYGATFGDVTATGRRWGHCTKAAGWGLRSQIHVVADGAEWIALQSREVFGEQAHFLLDFYHASEYLAAAAERCQPQAPTRWRHTQQQRLKRGAAPAVLAALAPHQEPASTGDEDAPVRAAHRYLLHRLDQLDYPRALRLELPIGSGLIESGHRHVLQARLKQPGTAWLPDNANALAHLRVLRANQRWTQLWN